MIFISIVPGIARLGFDFDAHLSSTRAVSVRRAVETGFQASLQENHVN